MSNIKDWDDPKINKLWLYNLHYFDDLNAIDTESRNEWHYKLLERWVQENPPAIGTAWEPYPTSLRVVNWIKWSLSKHELSSDCLHSLAVQVRWLMRRLEKHLLGNHLFVNAKALIFAGLFFKGQEADRWLNKGLRILKHEIPEQILADGGQFERSPMYHALALEDMLDLYNVIGAFSGESSNNLHKFQNILSEQISRMRFWLKAMSHSDMEISFFNDAAIGVVPSPLELENYAQRLRLEIIEELADGVTHLQDSGYIRVKHKDMNAILDVAPVGPDYLPGHAHADTLSFELSLHDRRVFVNSGTSQYGNDAERHRQRSTLTHNTVCVDGYDSSEVWGGFRVARRAYPARPEITQTKSEIIITCSHDGYTRLPGRCVHFREWRFGENSLAISDRVTGRFGNAIARYYLHPDISIKQVDQQNSVFEFLIGDKEAVQISFLGADSTVLESSFWHPGFGVSRDNLCIEAHFSSSQLTTQIEW